MAFDGDNDISWGKKNQEVSYCHRNLKKVSGHTFKKLIGQGHNEHNFYSTIHNLSSFQANSTEVIKVKNQNI